jgi:DNA-binding CsgD family transcriptional regulator
MPDRDDGPLIGRDRELAELAANVEMAEHGPACVLICGDAGVGKSALLRAAARHGRRTVRLTGDAEPARVLEQLTGDGPVLLLADDLRPEALLSLTESVCHASTGRVALLAAARDEAVPSGLSSAVQRLYLRPLAEDDAARLLDAEFPATAARDRRDILRRAAGNPLALRILSDPGGQVPAEFTQRVRALPATTRWLLLHAALADDAEHVGTLTEAARCSPDLRDWEPAERAGLVTIHRGQVRFRHPLLRAACAAGRSVSDVVRAHHGLASAVGDPQRRVRHLTESTTGTDEPVAAVLEAAAEAAMSRTDFFQAAEAFQAAAERGAGEKAALRYARATFAAHRSGHPEWAIELYGRTADADPDPDAAGVAAYGAAFSLVHTVQPWPAFELAARAIRRGPRDRRVTLMLAFVAANAAFYSGAAAHREQLPHLLARAGDGDSPPPGRELIPPLDDTVIRAAVLAVSDPGRHGRSVDYPLPAGSRPADLLHMAFTGTMAFLRDDSPRAANDLRVVFDASVRSDGIGSAVSSCHLMILAMIDSGRWADAASRLDEAERLAAVQSVPVLRVFVPVFRTILRALRGAGPAAEPEPLPLLTGTSEIETLTQRAAGLTALAAGDHPRAYSHFRRMFDEDGEPQHFFFGPRSLPQLAMTAARTGHLADGQRILGRCRAVAGPAPTTRMTMLLAHAGALLDETERAGPLFEDAIEDPERALRWPLEFAEAQLNYGLWLRGRRRTHEARAHLLAARDVFLRLGAHAHADQARRSLPIGLRPAGDPAPRPDAFTALTAQKQMIARMAAAGMTNRQIAERLFLSPRTVGSHLYRIYAELGVGTRHQLRTLIETGG